MNYDFSALNDKDLEELVRDLLSRRMGIDFQSFRAGTDQGVDLRFASDSAENQIVVQVKHYLNSGISKLKSDLKKKEFAKVKSLDPRRYILVTSLSLGARNKEEIKTIFDPYILSTQDVLGRNDLNALLRTNPEIEEAHLKLWLSSTAVLNRIVHNGSRGRSEFAAKKIKDKIKIFVPNRTYQNAVDVLNKNNFLLISGAPGVGKSTLAKILTYHLLAQEFELVYIREIKEGEDAFKEGKKQVFYFDDFLGSISLDLTSSGNVDLSIVEFIERVKGDKSKRLILTSRTVIINQAKAQSDRIGNSKLYISNHEVQIENYSNLDKARILYNHIYFSNLTEDLKSIFFEDQFYWTIITHANYNPRIIEFFTDIERLQTDVDYKKEVIEFLDNPARIWEKSYTVQISDSARLFLATMYSLGGKYIVKEGKLKSACDIRMEYEVAHNNFQRRGNWFNKTFVELSGSFIVRTLGTERHAEGEYKFLNPSIEDFLFHHYSDIFLDEYLSILRSAIYFEQFRDRITTFQEPSVKKVLFEGDNYRKLLDIFLKRVPILKQNAVNGDITATLILLQLFDWKEVADLVSQLVSELNPSELSWQNREDLIAILDYIGKYDLFEHFECSYVSLFLKITENIPSHYLLISLSELYRKYSYYDNLILEEKQLQSNTYKRYSNHIQKMWKKEYSYFLSQTPNLNRITDIEILSFNIEERKKEAVALNFRLHAEPPQIFHEHIVDIDDQIKKNIELSARNQEHIEINAGSLDSANEPLEINRLFNCETEINPETAPF